MLFPPKEKAGTHQILQKILTPVKDLYWVCLGLIKLRRSSLTAQIWSFIFCKVGIPVGKSKITIPLAYSLTSMALIGD